jgi:hypothetical protein
VKSARLKEGGNRDQHLQTCMVMLLVKMTPNLCKPTSQRFTVMIFKSWIPPRHSYDISVRHQRLNVGQVAADKAMTESDVEGGLTIARSCGSRWVPSESSIRLERFHRDGTTEPEPRQQAGRPGREALRRAALEAAG